MADKRDPGVFATEFVACPACLAACDRLLIKGPRHRASRVLGNMAAFSGVVLSANAIDAAMYLSNEVFPSLQKALCHDLRLMLINTHAHGIILIEPEKHDDEAAPDGATIQ